MIADAIRRAAGLRNALCHECRMPRRRGAHCEGCKTCATLRDRHANCSDSAVIRKLQSGKYRLYSRKVNPHTGKRRNLGTFTTRAAAERHERAVQYFKRGH